MVKKSLVALYSSMKGKMSWWADEMIIDDDWVNLIYDDCLIALNLIRIGFETQNCQTSTETSDSSSTICICDITGAYSVLVTSQFNKNSDQYNPEVELNPTDQEEYPEQYQYQLHQNQHQTNHVPIDIDNLLIISFLISIGLITLTIIIILIRSRWVQSDSQSIQFTLEYDNIFIVIFTLNLMAT